MASTEIRESVHESDSHSFTREYEAIASSVRTAREAVAKFALEHGADLQCAQNVRLAISEAVTNVVRHAYRNRSGDVRIAAAIREAELLVVISDDGRGREAQSPNPGLGAGLQIMNRVAECEFLEQDLPGSQVQLRFPLRAR